jgi:hypothetical protein
VLRWILGLLVAAVLIVMLGKSIPAAPRPTLGPPSVSPSSSR